MPPQYSVPTASLRTVKLSDLRDGHVSAHSNVIQAAKEDGVFYLDFEGTESSFLVELQREIQMLSKDIFELPSDEKMKFDVDKLTPFKTNGYKPIGRNVGGIAGQRDGFESYAIPCSGVTAASPSFSRPAILDSHILALRDLTSWCHEVALLIFQTLSKALGLPQDVSLDTLHSATASFDMIRLLRYEADTFSDTPRVPQAPHTDLGSLTFLFTETPGLQTRARDKEEWNYVMPKDSCIVVDLGDAMSMWTDGQLRSVLHRVASMPKHGMSERYSFALLMRPINIAPMVSLFPGKRRENQLRCDEWICAKFNALRGKSDDGVSHTLGHQEDIRTGRITAV